LVEFKITKEGALGVMYLSVDGNRCHGCGRGFRSIFRECFGRAKDFGVSSVESDGNCILAGINFIRGVKVSSTFAPDCLKLRNQSEGGFEKTG
jgi:hypothetical protein